MKLLKLVANLGYGSRKQVAALFGEGLVTDANGDVLYADDVLDKQVAYADIRIDGEPLDVAPGFLAMLHKPVGVTCSTKDPGRIVYDLLPPRWRLRDPIVSTIGRLDRDTSGLLLLTDDGALLHRVTSPKAKLAKVYEVTTARPIDPGIATIFASGTLMLESEDTPLLPATLDIVDDHHARLTLTEGRYHQVRRMFAAVGNHVDALHRPAIGALALGDLPPGEWRLLSPDEVASVDPGRR